MKALRDEFGRFKKGNIPWSKEGLRGIRVSPNTEFKKGSKLSDETKEKISMAMKGREITWNHKIKNTLMGHGVSTSTRKKISQARKGKLMGEINPSKRPEIREKIRLSKMGSKNAMWGKMSGPDNPNWNGGASFEPYGREFNKELKAQIRTRDNCQCQICYEFENGRCHDVHHIDYDKKNNAPENLITLCQSCHRKTNFNRTHWDYWLGR